MSFVEGIKSDLNRIRVEPLSFQKLFKNMRNTLERFKGKNHPLVKEADQFLLYLAKAPSITELSVSKALIKMAEKRLDIVEVMGKYEPVLDSALSEYASRYGTDFNVINELVDDGAQEPEEVLSRLVMNENDKERINRKIIFDPKTLFFGVGHRIVDEKHYTIIIFADNIKDLPEKSIDSQISERLNRIRSKPLSFVNDFENTLKIINRFKKSTYLGEECQSVINQLKNENPKPVLKDSEYLKDVAKKFIASINNLKNSNILDVNELISTSKELVTGFKVIIGAGSYNIGDPDRIITKLLVNEFDTNHIIRKGLFDENIQFVGIHHENVGYVPITVVVFADDAQSPDLRSLEDKVTIEFNKIRKNPNELIEALTNYLGLIENSSKKQNQIKYIEDLINQLKNGKALPELRNSKPLSQACEEFLKINGKQTSVFDSRVYREEKEFLETRLTHYCTGFKEVFQFVEAGHENIKDIIFNLLIDPRDENHDFRRALLDEKTKYFGIGKNEFKNKPLTSVIFADNVEDINSKVFVDSLFEEINHLRKNPKSYLKLYEDLLEKIPNTSVAQKASAYKMTTFLKSSRFYGPLQRSDLLTKAAEARLAFLKQENKHLIKPSEEDSKMFLSDYCSGYLNVAEITTKGYQTSLDLRINRRVEDDFQTGLRSYIFSPKLFYIGLAYDEESRFQVIFFADFVEEKKDDNIYVHSHWRKINRPELTEDEDLQIRKDFHKLDVLNRGVIMPQHIYTIMLMSPEFEHKNPIYFNAIKNNIENLHFQQAGINIDEFVVECKKVLNSFESENWNNIYTYLLQADKKILDYEVFRNLTSKLGFKISNEECDEIIKKLSDEKGKIDMAQFTVIVEAVMKQR